MEKKLKKIEKVLNNWIEYIAILDSIMKPSGEGARAEFEREFTVATSKVINTIRSVEKVLKEKIWEDFE